MSVSSADLMPTNIPHSVLAAIQVDYSISPCGNLVDALPKGASAYCCEDGSSHMLEPINGDEHVKCSNGEGGKNFLDVGDILCSTEVEFSEDGVKTSFKAERLIDEAPPLLSEVARKFL